MTNGHQPALRRLSNDTDGSGAPGVYLPLGPANAAPLNKMLGRFTRFRYNTCWEPVPQPEENKPPDAPVMHK